PLNVDNLPQEVKHARQSLCKGVSRQPSLAEETQERAGVFTHCAGLDGHKKSVTACRLVSESTGQHPEGVAELRTFGTMTRELLALADWLVEAGVTHSAMESTGEYWKPVDNLLEGLVTICLVN